MGSILIYAADQDCCEEYLERVEKGQKTFGYIPSVMRYARTDITAFVFKALYDLDVLDDEGEESAKDAIMFNNQYGPGLLVYPTH